MKMLATELSSATVFWSQVEKKSPNATLAKPSATHACSLKCGSIFGSLPDFPSLCP